MENLINLVNKIQRACTALGYHGETSALLWDSLSAIAVVGGQSSGKSSVLESIVSKSLLPHGSATVRKEIQDKTDQETSRTNKSRVFLFTSIFILLMFCRIQLGI